MTDPLSSQVLGHPLAADPPVVSCTVLDHLRRLKPGATLTELLLNDYSPEGAEVWFGYLLSPARVAAEFDRMLLVSLLATAELHQRGTTWRLLNGGKTSKEEDELVSRATAVYSRKKDLIEAYRLEPAEVLAIEAYSDANKSVPTFGAQHNPHYMGEHKQWGTYNDGWVALGFALRKIPSLGQLGLTLTTYRATRAPKPGDTAEISKLTALKVGTNVELGKTVMDMGQRHYLSTAVTYNSHWARALQVGGLVALTGQSGWLINPFGAQGWLDGGEVLYPPSTVTVYEGTNLAGYSEAGATAPVAHLREIAEIQRGQAVADDSNYGVSTKADPQIERNKQKLLSWLSTMKDQQAVRREIAKVDTDGVGVAGLSYDQLRDIYTKLAFQ